MARCKGGELNTLIFLSFNARALVGFAEKLGLPYKAVGLKYAFPKLNYEPIEGEPRELFFPDEEKLVKIAKGGKGAGAGSCRLPVRTHVEGGDIALLNPFRFLHIGFFELKYLFGFDWPTIVDKNALIDFVVGLTYEGLMESTDGANLIWRAWRRGGR